MALDVTILQPTAAQERGLLHLEADPLPVQFTGMTGSAGSAPGMPAIGGALGGDWNAAGNLAPETPHWPARTPTWIRLGAADADGTCSGFLTLLQPRKAGAPPALSVELVERLAGGAATLRTAAGASTTLYLLGDRPAAAGAAAQLRGVAGVVGTNSTSNLLTHAVLVQGALLAVPGANVRVATSRE
eukprot:gene2388-5120_t